MTGRAADRERGQASLETVALLPICVAGVAGLAQLLAAGAAHEAAGHVAGAAAMALIQGEDPQAVAREAAPDWSRRRLRVRVSDGQVQVRIRPVAPVDAVGDLLAATARADAGARP